MLSRRHLVPPPILPPEVAKLKYSEMPEEYRQQIDRWAARVDAACTRHQREARAFLIISAAVFFIFGAAIFAVLFR